MRGEAEGKRPSPAETSREALATIAAAHLFLADFGENNYYRLDASNTLSRITLWQG